MCNKLNFSKNMKNNIYKIGVVFIIAMFGIVPAVSFAEGSSEGVNAEMQVGAQVKEVHDSTTSEDMVARMGVGMMQENKDNHEAKDNEGSREDNKSREHSKSPEVKEAGDSNTSTNLNEKSDSKDHKEMGDSKKGDMSEKMSADEKELSLMEEDETPVVSVEALQKRIEDQTMKLENVISSTTSNSEKAKVQGTFGMRIAVNSLMVSKNILGSVGQQVSEVAKQIKASIATTTQAETEIQDRGFFTRLLFGGDTEAANVIKNEVAQNQKHIQDLTQLLGQTNISKDIQITLQAQINALKDAQARLQDLAQSEQDSWGIFSWRF